MTETARDTRDAVPAESSDATASPSAFVARQAVFDRQGDLWAYELLFRSCEDNCYTGTEQSLATIQVLSTSLFSIGLDRLLSGRPALINFGRELLLTDWSTILPADVAIIEILEDVVSDPEILLKCAALRKGGYRIALDDFVPGRKTEPLIPFADIIKVDVRTTPVSEQQRILSRYQPRGIRMLAEKVETPEEFRIVRDMGFDFFQGFFFAFPVVMSGKTFPVEFTGAIRLMRELQYPQVDYRRIEEIVRSDVAFTYKLLRYVNSALFGKTRAISSVSQALIYLGEADIRKWIGVAVMDVCSRGKSRELVVQSLVRARFCELLALELSLDSSDAFLVGMFSLLDALLHRPMGELAGELCLSPEIAAALLHTDASGSRMSRLFDLSLCYEKADWKAVSRLAAELSLSKGLTSRAYIEAVNWTQRMRSGQSDENAKK
jgi:EAL and modified HD-GYP domain-containing signal transduction protein